MLDVQNRLPTPGKENRVKITQDSGAVVEGVLSYVDDATQDGTFWNRKNGQLLQGDIRELTIKDGESISAGDVVNVDDGVYRDVTPQANVENLLYSSALSDISLCYLNDNNSIAALKTSVNSITDVYIVDNKTGLGRASSRLSSDYHQYVKVAKLSDTKFISLYVGSSAYSKIGTVSSSSISFGSQYTVASSVSNMADVIALSDNLALSIYNSSGLKCKVLPISGTTITTSGTVYSLPNNTGANYISACKLPDDSNGNKRVCICFADTGDGNKGKAVIATIDSSNAVTFGDVVIFNSTGETCDIAVAANTSGIMLRYSYKSSTGAYFGFAVPIKVENDDTVSIGTPLQMHSGQADTDIVDAGNGFITVWRQYATYLTSNYPEVVADNQYEFNSGESYKVSLSKTSKDMILVAYADGDNNHYGTTTVLEVLGNQIAGSFLDNSKDAIALASGSGGDIIPVGFGGYCQCDGVIEGQEIISDGVSAFSPLDGWLCLLSTGMKRLGAQIQIVSYVGTGTYGSKNPCSITVDFPIEIIIYLGRDRGNNIQDGFISTGPVMLNSRLTFDYEDNVGFNESSNVSGKKSLDSHTFYWYNTIGSTEQLNHSGYTYYFLCLG